MAGVSDRDCEAATVLGSVLDEARFLLACHDSEDAELNKRTADWLDMVERMGVTWRQPSPLAVALTAARAEEREACAAICKDWADGLHREAHAGGDFKCLMRQRSAATYLWNQIRARGQADA